MLPYTDATQSGVAAMAFGFGRPAIVTNVGGLPDVICDGYNGLLVPPKDAGALAEAMSRLIVNDDLRNRLTAGASDYGSTELSWEFVARQTSAAWSIRPEPRMAPASSRVPINIRSKAHDGPTGLFAKS